jgi:uncharacterized protein (DUF362 family)
MNGALLGAGVLISNRAVNLLDLTRIPIEKIDLSIVRGDDYYASTIKAVEALGGMKRFVSKGSTVGILVNSRYNKPGAYVKPEITLAAITLCLGAGAKKIISLENVQDSYWHLNSFSKDYSEAIGDLKYAGNNFKKAKIQRGISLKDAEVEADFLDCDTYINIPIFKQHEGVRITGCLKNLMGLTSQDTNRYFHSGSKAGDGYSNLPFLSQCIADVNLLRKPDLCIADATEYITTNGPFGPGEIVKAKKVVAGTDIVAVDSMGAKILGYDSGDIMPIRLAYKNGLGEIDLSKVKIRES